MKREAWEAMNNSLINKYKNKVNHQIISDSLVEDLHEAGFVIVPHEPTPKMYESVGVDIEGNTQVLHEVYKDYTEMVAHCIKNRQRSEQ